MFRFLSLLLALILLTAMPVSAGVPDNIPFDVNADSAVLMEAETGTVLYAKNADQALPPASVTKIMTLLLVMEAIDNGQLSWEDIVTASATSLSPL